MVNSELCMTIICRGTTTVIKLGGQVPGSEEGTFPSKMTRILGNINRFRLAPQEIFFVIRARICAF